MKDNLIVRFAIPQNLLLLSVTCPVMYSCSSILEQKSSRKSCRKAVSLRFHFPFSSFWLSYTTPWVSSPCPCFNFTLPKQCSLPLIVVESCHDGGDAGKNSHPASWSEFHLCQYRSEDLRRKEQYSRVERKGCLQLEIQDTCLRPVLVSFNATI